MDKTKDPVTFKDPNRIMEMLTFDKSDNIHYTEHVRINFDVNRNILNVTHGRRCQVAIRATLSRHQFFTQKNALVVFAPRKADDFVLIFEDERKCQNIYNMVCNCKKFNAGGHNDELFADEEGNVNVEQISMEERFLSRAFKDQSTMPDRLKDILANFVKDTEYEDEYAILMDPTIMDMIAAAAAEIDDECFRSYQPSTSSPEDVIPKVQDIKIKITPIKREIIDDVITLEEDEVIEQKPNINLEFPSSINETEQRQIDKIKSFDIPLDMVPTPKVPELVSFNFISGGNKLKKKPQKFMTISLPKLPPPIFKINTITNTAADNDDEPMIIDEKEGEGIVKNPHQQQPSNPKVFAIPLTNNEIVNEAHFKLVNFNQNEIMVTKLIVFTSVSKKFCYEYSWNNIQLHYYCFRCFLKRKTLKAFIRHYTDGKRYVELEGNDHICEEILYNPTKYMTREFVKKPLFEILRKNDKSKELLLIYDSEARNSYYEYFWCKNNKAFCCHSCTLKNVYVKARYYEAKDIVELDFAKHICERRPISSLKIISAPNFEIESYHESGIEKQKLFIFDPNDSTMCHEYLHRIALNLFICNPCQKKKVRVVAELYQNSNGEEIIKHGPTQHVCLMKSRYDSGNDNVINKSDFKIQTYNNGTKRIFIFADAAEDDGDNEKNLCYEFSQRSGRNTFRCLGCTANKRDFAIKFHENSKTGESFVSFKSNQIHQCTPREYDPERFEKTLIYLPNFHFYHEKGNKKKTKLIVFPTENNDDQTKCYKYGFEKKSSAFTCVGCARLKKKTSAKVFKNPENGEEYIRLGNDSHICTPFNYSDIGSNFQILHKSGGFDVDSLKLKKVSKDKIIKPPMFEISKSVNGISKLVIFKTKDKKQWYQYDWDKHSSYFKCRRCKAKRRNVIAKLWKNNDKDRGNVVLGKNEHCCQAYASKELDDVLEEIREENEMLMEQ